MADSLPTTGSLYWFRTSQFFKSVTGDTHRFAAFKVLGINDSRVLIATLDGVWKHPPSISDVQPCGILNQHCFAHRGQQAVWSIAKAHWDTTDLCDCTFLGTVALTEHEELVALPFISNELGTTWACLPSANFAAEGEWRWANDRERFVSEKNQHDTLEAQRRAAQVERYEKRLRGLTWAQLLAETPFAGWTPSPPYPSEDFAQAARTAIHDACRSLQTLGNKPRKAEVRRVLRKCVEWFNEADEQAGGVIETEEREGICAALEEIAHVARQASLVEEIDEWRKW